MVVKVETRVNIGKTLTTKISGKIDNTKSSIKIKTSPHHHTYNIESEGDSLPIDSIGYTAKNNRLEPVTSGPHLLTTDPLLSTFLLKFLYHFPKSFQRKTKYSVDF